MPPVPKKKVNPSASKPSSSPPKKPAARADHAEVGLALSLADAARECGVEPADLAASPQRLAECGLPASISRVIVSRAHQLFREHVDALLWQANWNWIREVLDRPGVERVDPVAAARVQLAQNRHAVVADLSQPPVKTGPAAEEAAVPRRKRAAESSEPLVITPTVSAPPKPKRAF